jgi:hypothetical protein
MNVTIIVLTLLIIVVTSWFTLWRQYTLLKRIERNLTLALKQSKDKEGNANDTSNQ